MKQTNAVCGKKYMASTARREQILRVACELFATSGYDTVSIRTIAAECGCSASLIMKFFKTKEDIFQALVAKFEAYCSIPVIDQVPDGTGLEALMSLYIKSRGHLTIGPSSYGYLLRCAIESRPSHSHLVYKALAYFQNLEQEIILPLVQKGQADKSLPLCNPITLAHILTCALFGTDYLEQRFPEKKQTSFNEILYYVLKP